MKKQILASLVCLFTASLAFAGDYHGHTTTTTTENPTLMPTEDPNHVRPESDDYSTTNTTYSDPYMKYQTLPVYPTTMQEARSMSEIPADQRTTF